MNELADSRKIGIVAHSYEGGALCFLTTCREGALSLGPHMHPKISLSAIPMGICMEAWEQDDYPTIGQRLLEGISEVAASGADFFVCPDNTAHLVLDEIITQAPIPGLHIAHVVCNEIVENGFKNVGLLGTKWTMTGSSYEKAFEKFSLNKITPDPSVQSKIDKAIFDELCQSEFKPDTVNYFLKAIDELKEQGAECVVLGCTEIPLIVTPENSSLPTMDSTRLLAKYAVRVAIGNPSLPNSGWIDVTEHVG